MATILHRLAEWAETDSNSIAQRFKRNGQWTPITAREYCDRVYWMALFLESKGMTSNDIGAMLAYNSPGWVHTELAFLLLGAKSAGIYPNSSGKDIGYILNHTECRFLALGGAEYFNKISEKTGGPGIPERIKLIISLNDDTSFSPIAVGYEDAIKEGQKLAAKKGAKTLKDFLAKTDPDAGAFMIYTSGTTGTPKGAILSQENLVYIIDLASKYWNLKTGDGSLFSFLPLCHIAEKIQNVGGGISLRYTVNFCTAFDNVGKELPEVEPTLLLCVPRLWEKMMEGVMAKVDQSTGVRKQLALWSLAVGARMAEARFNHKNPALLDWVQWKIADRVVLSKIRKVLGLGKAQILASGAAALPIHVCKWFRSLGLEIGEAFGQTECAGIICLTVPGQDCAGTVGRPVPGLEFQIAEDGEILTRGKHVFKGYFKDKAATDQVLEGGWLHTGDLGEWTDKGFVRIRGRKKEILKTSGGKMVAPVPIEEALKAAPMISQVCMVGDGRKYLAALITLSEAKLSEISKNNGAITGTIVTQSTIIREVGQYVDELNRTLASYEQIKKFAILNREFSIAEGEMTPTLKMKRNVIESRFRDVIEALYDK